MRVPPPTDSQIARGRLFPETGLDRRLAKWMLPGGTVLPECFPVPRPSAASNAMPGDWCITNVVPLFRCAGFGLWLPKLFSAPCDEAVSTSLRAFTNAIVQLEQCMSGFPQNLRVVPAPSPGGTHVSIRTGRRLLGNCLRMPKRRRFRGTAVSRGLPSSRPGP